MKKLLASLLAVLMLFMFAACGTTNAPSSGEADVDTSWDYIKEKGELIVGLDDTFAPMGFRNEAGELVGFDIDLANALGEKLGVKIKFQPIDWEAKELELSGKKIDVIWNGMSVTPERQESMNLSTPYLNNTIVIMTKKGSDIKSKDDLIGKNLGTQAGSSGLKVIMADDIYKDIKDKLSEYKTYDEALMDLETGRLDAIIVDKVLGMYKASIKADTFDFADEDFGEDLYVIGIRKGEEALTEKINGVLSGFAKDGTAESVSKKWFDENIFAIK
jgi:polar amino acid transport system substrate-binding protein